MRAIGIIETKGMAAALEAADAAVKSANVELLGYELSRGAGQVTVKLEGDVSAITAAVEAGAQAASAVNKVIATLIMGRPHEDVAPLIYSSAMVGLPEKEEETSQETPVEEPLETVETLEEKLPEEPVEDTVKPVETVEEPEEEPLEEPEEPLEFPEITCNLCRDPQCPRKKGEPRAKCLHNGEN